MSPPVLDIRDLVVSFPVRNAWGRKVGAVQAVRGISLTVAPGETLGLVGESGCGKSTLARAIVRLVPITSGDILVQGVSWASLPERRLRPLRPAVQMVFQDPYSSLNPRLRVGDIVAEPLIIHRRGSRREIRDRVAQLLDQVGLHPDDAAKFPHEFSGGQRQRIGIARAIALGPRLLLADEAVSALDVSIQAQILNLLLDLKDRHGHSMLFISHDLRVVEQISDRVAVMYMGRIVEVGTPAVLFAQPRHPYTRALLEAVPQPDPSRRRLRAPLAGEPPSPLRPPSGCAFRLRCAYADARCAEAVPECVSVDSVHAFACHHPLQ